MSEDPRCPDWIDRVALSIPGPGQEPIKRAELMAKAGVREGDLIIAFIWLATHVPGPPYPFNDLLIEGWGAGPYRYRNPSEYPAASAIPGVCPTCGQSNTKEVLP